MSPAESELPGLYVKAMESTRRFVGGVAPDQWGLPTPCTEWNARQLVNHTVYEMLWVPEMLAGKTVQEVGAKYDGDVLGDDPQAAFDAAYEAARAAVRRPGAMEATCHLSRGDTTGAAYLRSMINDVFIHGWDLAKATGQDTTLDDDLVAACYEIAEAGRERRRGSRAFAPEIEVAPDANQQTRLLAMLGRRS